MDIEQPNLFIEINEKNFIFLVVKYNQDLNFKILDTSIVKSDGIENGRVINIKTSSEILKKNLNLIENKIGYTFKKAIIINNQNNYNCINVTGFKNIGGSQISEDDISYILNELKTLILDNEKHYSLIHLFNSNYILDNSSLKNLPIGLFGDTYNHHLTFFLLLKNDLKNLKHVLNNCHIDVERVVLRPFAEGIYKITNQKIKEDFLEIKMRKKSTSISIFKDKSLIYSQDFLFGSEIILKDIAKVCSLSIETVNNILEEINFDNLSEGKKEEYLDKKYFKDIIYRKVSINIINEIIDSRLTELIYLIYKKNINLQFFKNEIDKIYFTFEDKKIYSNTQSNIISKFSKNIDIAFQLMDQNDELNGCIGSAILNGSGWEREAIPTIQTKKSIISRIFSTFFT